MKYSIITFLLFLNTILSFGQEKTYKDYVDAAFDLTTKKDFKSAEKAYKTALKLEPSNPTNAMLFMNLGTIQRYLGKYDEALISYNILAEKYPNLKYILESRAALYCEMEQYENALNDYNSILLNDPNNIDVRYQRGLLLMSLKNITDAESDFKQILTTDKKNIQGNLGMAMLLKRKKEWKKAEELYTDLISENKKDAMLYANRAEVQLYLKKLRSMEEDINKAIELGYQDPSIYVLKGQLNLERFNNEEALTDFIKAKEEGADSITVNEFITLCKTKKDKNLTSKKK